MDEIIRKSGDVLVDVNLVPARAMARVVPRGARIHELLPGIACYAIGLFRYTRLYDPRPGRGKDDFRDCYDAGILVPVEYPGRGRTMHVMRLCNSDPAVVEWAGRANMGKRGVDVTWIERDGRIEVDATAENGERYVMKVRPLVSLPRLSWRLWPTSMFAAGVMAREHEGTMYGFPFRVGIDHARTWLVRGESRLEGFDLPRPAAHVTVLVRDFTPFTMWEGQVVAAASKA